MKKSELKEFLRYLKEHYAGSELTKSIEEKVNFAKKNMTWRKQYMTWQQTIDDEKEDAYEEGLADGREAGRVEGLAQGASQKAIEDALNALKMNLSVEQVSKITNLSPEKVRELAKNIASEVETTQ